MPWVIDNRFIDHFKDETNEDKHLTTRLLYASLYSDPNYVFDAVINDLIYSDSEYERIVSDQCHADSV